MPATARQRLLDAAAELFYAHGIAATGIDAVIARAGTAKKSLYNNFANKDALVQEYLRARHEEWLALYRTRAAGSRTPQEKVLAVFDAYADHARAVYVHGFRGCGLLNGAAELPADSAGRRAVREHKEEVERLLREPLEEITDDQTARTTAEHLSFLLEGAISRAGLEGTPERLASARSLAEGLLDVLPRQQPGAGRPEAVRADPSARATAAPASASPLPPAPSAQDRRSGS